MMRILLLGLLLAGSTAINSYSQDGGLAFLRIGANASASSMGDAQVSSSSDAFSTFWNPAGLAAAQSNSLALSHHIWLADTRNYFITGRFQAGDNSGFGAFVSAFDSGDFDARVGPGERDGVFSAQFIGVGASYGQAIGPVRFGVTAKFLSEQVFNEDATGYAFDFGVQADFFQEGIKIGAALQNVGEMTELNVEATQLPRTLRAGISIYPFRVLAMADGTVLLNAFLTGEVSHITNLDQTRFHIGAAAEVVELVTVRAGFITNDDLRGLSIGGGLGSNGFLFDYAFLPFDDGFGGPGHVLTLLYEW